MPQNEDPRGPNHKSIVDSVEVVAEASADGAYEMRLTKSTTGGHAPSRGDASSPVGGSLATGPRTTAPLAIETKRSAMPLLVVGAVLLAGGGIVAWNSLAGSAPPPSRADTLNNQASENDSDADAGGRRRAVVPVEGFRVYQGEVRSRVSATGPPTVNLDFSQRLAADAGAREDTAQVEDEQVDPLQQEPEAQDELPPEVIQRMREVPVIAPGQAPGLPEGIELIPSSMGVRATGDAPLEVQLPIVDDEGYLDDEMADEDEPEELDDEEQY